jgi:cytochrome c553
MKSLLALTIAAAFAVAGVCAHAEEPAKAAAKPDPAKGQEKATQICGACHTFDGTRGLAANPILQGQHPEYIAKQLSEFKSGRRANPVMTAMVSPLTDDDVRNLAAFYAGKQAKPGFAKNKDTVLLGEKIYRGGIAAKQVPACAGCHSPNGAGIPAQYPRLAGQHAEYSEAQLVAFRAGTRANGPMMVSIAARMSDKEIKAVADYMAGLR